MMRIDKRYRNEKGSALVYILIAIALLAALTIAFMNPSSNQTTSQNTFRTVSEIQSQIEFIRTSIQECTLTYPGGDSGALSYTSSHNYPMRPSHNYFDAQCGAGESAADDKVEGLRCPGNPGDDPCHTDIFGGTTGKFLPPAPSFFSDWYYYNGPNGVFIWTETTNTDAFLDTVVEKLDSGFSECEADVVDTSFGGAGDKNLDNAGNAVCTHVGSRKLCFRVWLIIRPSAVYNGDRDGDEGGC